ncbi:MAG: hypothetical protein JNM36_03825 [Chitinophagales bacterium]|nr:hypothetical protein [Chitinophagales bacterium]
MPRQILNPTKFAVSLCENPTNTRLFFNLLTIMYPINHSQTVFTCIVGTVWHFSIHPTPFVDTLAVLLLHKAISS